MLFSGTMIALLSTAYFVTDTVVAGIMMGESTVEAVNVVLPIYSMANFIALVFTLGIPILYVNNLGAFRKEEADRFFGMGVILTTLIGALLFLILLFFGDGYIHYYVQDGLIYTQAKDYLEWIKYSVMLVPLNYLLVGMIYADGDEDLSTMSGLVAGIGHIVLSVIFCYKMGASGLGLASFVSMAASFPVLFIHFFRKKNTLSFRPSFSVRYLGKILKYGIVDAGAYLFISVFTAGVSYFMIGYFGVEVLIVVSVFSLLKELQLIFDGIGEAVTPIMSMYLGEETYPGVRNVWRLARRSVRIESLIMSVLIVIFAPQIISVLGIEDPYVAGEAILGLRLLSVTLIFSCRMFLDSSYFILIDKIPLGVLACALRDLIPALPLTILGGWIGGIYGMFVGLMISPVLGYALLILYVRIRYGPGNYALFLCKKEKQINKKLYEFPVTPVNIIQVRDQIGDELKENGYSDDIVNKTMLLFEELFMSIHDGNKGKKVHAECAVEMGERIRLVLKDDGEKLDLTDMDREVNSLRSYILSNLIGTYTRRRVHFLTLSYNRNAIEVN